MNYSSLYVGIIGRLARFRDTYFSGDRERLKIVSVRFFLILLCYYLVRKVFYMLTDLPTDAYHSDIIFLEFLKNGAKNVYSLLGILLFFVFLNRRLFVPWKHFEKGISIRNFVFFNCAILTFIHAFSYYNFYFDSAHLWDRALLSFLLALSFWRPFFVLPLLGCVLLNLGQFEILSGFSPAGSLLPIQLLFMFISLFLIKLATGYFKFLDLVFLMGCVIASNYIFSAAGKIYLNWLFTSRIDFVVSNSYATGWLGIMDVDQISWLAKRFYWLDIPLKIFTLVVEGGFFFIFWKRKWTKALLMATVLLHTGIFLVTGILFWVWSLVHLVILVFLLRTGFENEKSLFNRKYLVISMVIIVTSLFWNKPVILAWLDVPFTYSHKMVGMTDTGRTVRLSPDFFAPYDYQFTLTRFNCLDDRPRLGVIGGATRSNKIMGFFSEVRSDEEILAFEKSAGTVDKNNRERKETVEFISRFVENWNKNKNRKEVSFLKAIGPPDLLWTNKKDEVNLRPDEQIKKIAVVTITSYYNKENGYREIAKDTVLTIPISLK